MSAVILILAYEGEPEASQSEIFATAEQIAGRMAAKKVENLLEYRSLQITSETARTWPPKNRRTEAFAVFMASPAAKSVEKLAIIAHGNRREIGKFNAAGLADLVGPVVKGKAKLGRITLHSCDSAVADTERDDAILVEQFGAALLAYLEPGQNIVVRGAAGHNWTDSTGRNWVLNEGVTDPAQFPHRDKENTFILNNTVARGAARPRYALKKSKGYASVTAL